MIFKTRGIVFHRIKYSESSLITRIYTEQFGLCSFLVQGARKKNSSAKANLLQPLSLIELVAYHKENAGLQKVKEIKNDYPLISLQSDFAKTSIALFLSEFLTRSIREECPNKNLFSFLRESLIVLDQLENPANFHLLFLLKLSRYLGFFPQPLESESKNTHLKEPHAAYKNSDIVSAKAAGAPFFFNLAEGVFEANRPAHQNYINPEFSGFFSRLISMEYEELDRFLLDGKTRKILLEKIIDFYRLHLEGIKEIKSHHVLETVLRE